MATRRDRLNEAANPVPAPASMDEPVTVVLSDLVAALADADKAPKPGALDEEVG